MFYNHANHPNFIFTVSQLLLFSSLFVSYNYKYNMQSSRCVDEGDDINRHPSKMTFLSFDCWTHHLHLH
ncbi:hypothetical protein L1987_73893 [Smallanthus sonchifolius]|uniref:Uncharacterized protein n=1 Tax=Smallanthus sonchifolius TaxID=185202 RepID=A0ACB9A167_9ASTR|nr:hypothetical protein L1987_73893 [Smallanthus sonchifolius]